MIKKNPKPLTYLVHPSLMETETIQKYISKGHTVINGECLVDVVAIGQSCYRITEDTIDLLDLVTKAERASKYPTKAKDETEK